MKHNPHDWIRTVTIILILIIIFFFIIWAMCGWESECQPNFVVYDLGLSAPWCCTAQYGGGSDIENMPSDDSCPPLDDKLATDIPEILALGWDFCSDNGGIIINRDTMVGCEDPLGRIDEATVRANLYWTPFETACLENGGKTRIDPNRAVCFCPGDESWGDFNCGRVYEWGQGTWCDGGCESGESCVEVEGKCHCAMPCENIRDTKMCYLGLCPKGQICNLNIATDMCECIDEPL